MLISVIMPCLNAVSTIRASIDSVLTQEHCDLELVIVDGGSTDGTVDVIRDASEGRINVKWVSEPDQGLSDAVNKGLALASGDLLCWLNADDLFVPGALSHVTADVDGRHGFLVGDCVIHKDGKRLMSVRPRFFSTWCIRSFGNYLCQPGSFFTRQAFRELGPLRVDLRYAMDLEYFHRAMVRGIGFKRVPVECAVFNIHSGQLSSRFRDRQIAEELSVYGKPGPLARLLLASKANLLVYSALGVYPWGDTMGIITAKFKKAFKGGSI